MKRSDVGFTASVKRAQQLRGSREGYARVMERHDWPGEITDDLAAFLRARDSVYLGTASAEGQPYIQHRGGPVGFIKILDEHRFALADYAGNKQYISLGNLQENDRAFLFAMDYPHRRRIKIWGRARFVEDDPVLLAQVTDPEHSSKPERVLVFEVAAWDVNCRQHITPRYSVEELSEARGTG